jgi:hypothetical protein
MKSPLTQNVSTLLKIMTSKRTAFSNGNRITVYHKNIQSEQEKRPSDLKSPEFHPYCRMNVT